MSGSLFPSFIREQRRMDAAEHDPRTALTRHAADRVAAQRIAGVDADTDDVPGRNIGGIDLVERFVNEVRVSPSRPGRGGQHVQPARGNDRDAEHRVAGVDQMYTGLA